MGEMIARDITPIFLDAVKTHPVVTVFGPRQCGKTTLVRHVLPEYNYVNLENPKERRLAMEGWGGDAGEIKNFTRRGVSCLDVLEGELASVQQLTGASLMVNWRQLTFELPPVRDASQVGLACFTGGVCGLHGRAVAFSWLIRRGRVRRGVLSSASLWYNSHYVCEDCF